MKEDYQKEIEGIIAGMNCPKDFKCYKSNFKYICRVNIFGFEGVLECLEESYDCNFSRKYINKYQCTCPLRNYIAKKLKK